MGSGRCLQRRSLLFSLAAVRTNAEKKGAAIRRWVLDLHLRPSYKLRFHTRNCIRDFAWPAIRNSRTSCTARGARTRRAPSCSPSSRARSRSPPRHGLPDPDMNRALASRHPGSARGKHAEGQYRARHQEGVRLRHRKLRDDPLRGLWPRRCRHHRRGAVQQSQPHRRGRARGLHQVRRQPRRHRRGRRIMFAHVGEIAYPAAAGSADAVLDAAIEAGADDVKSDASGHLVTCAFEDLGGGVGGAWRPSSARRRRQKPSGSRCRPPPWTKRRPPRFSS